MDLLAVVPFLCAWPPVRDASRDRVAVLQRGFTEGLTVGVLPY